MAAFKLKIIWHFKKNNYFHGLYMQENSTSQPVAAEQQQKACISCGNPQILKGYPNALCEECREKYIKFPIPLWVKAFGGALALVVLFLLFNLPKTLSIGIAYEKGVKADVAKKYITEQRQMEHVLQAMPTYDEAKARLLIAAFYNQDLPAMADASKKLEGKSFDNDDELMNRANAIVDKLNSYVPSEALSELYKKYPDSTGGMPDTVYLRYMAEHPDDIFVKTIYASILDNKNNYAAADSLLLIVLQKDGDYIPALELMQGLKRVVNDTKASMEYCDRLLSINTELPYALAGKARTFLKIKETKQGLQYALQAYNSSPDDKYASATLVLAYHFNNMPKERDALVERVKQADKGGVNGTLQYALDIINGKDKL